MRRRIAMEAAERRNRYSDVQTSFKFLPHCRRVYPPMMRKMMKPMMRSGEPLTATPQAKLMRGESSSVAQNRKLSSVHGRRRGIIVGPGNLPSFLYVSCKASWAGQGKEVTFKWLKIHLITFKTFKLKRKEPGEREGINIPGENAEFVILKDVHLYKETQIFT